MIGAQTHEIVQTPFLHIQPFSTAIIGQYYYSNHLYDYIDDRLLQLIRHVKLGLIYCPILAAYSLMHVVSSEALIASELQVTTIQFPVLLEHIHLLLVVRGGTVKDTRNPFTGHLIADRRG